MKTGRSWLILTIASGLLLGAEVAGASAQSSDTRLSASNKFSVCPGTFALCTVTKPCPPSSSNSTTLDCSCTVTQGYSAGQQPCTDVPTTPPKPGMSIPSRYSPISSMVVCQQAATWAWCLDKSCTIDAGSKTATCKCLAVSAPNWAVVTPSFSASTCKAGVNVSSATVDDIVAITGFLETQPQLRPKPITIVGVGAPPSGGAAPGNQKP